MPKQTLNVYLVNKHSGYSMFEDSHRTACAAKLTEYFKEIINGSARYDAVAVSWTGKKADPTAFDFVCYVLTSQADSIAKDKADGASLGPSGSTVQASDKTILSEVYLRQIVQGGDPRALATADREILVANCILHELGHNLLDAGTPVLTDVHKLQGGVILRDTDSNALKSSDRPNAVDKTSFVNGFGRRVQGVKQYVDAMPA